MHTRPVREPSQPQQTEHPTAVPGRTDNALIRRLQTTELAWIAVLFIGFSVLAYHFPPNGDDWAWGSQIGVDRLHHFFAGYNGRYAANLVILTLSRSTLLAAIVVGAGLTATIHLVLAITRNRTSWGYAVVTALLLAMPHSVWGQSISWLSGFTNYALATLWVLVYLRCVQLDWGTKGSARVRWSRALCIVAFAFLASLFMENVTLFFVVASVVVLIAQRRTFGRSSRSAACWVVGFVLGAITMFSNSAYRRASTGSQSYQKVTGLHGMVGKAVRDISGFAVVDNLVLNVVVVAFIALLTVPIAHSRMTRSSFVPLALAGAFLVVAVPLEIAERGMHVDAAWRRFGGLAALLLIASLCAASWWLVQSPPRRATVLGLVGSAVVVLGPLLIVSPIGPRCFYVSYVLLIAIVSALMREACDQLGTVATTGLGALGATVAVGLFAGYFAVYLPMSHAADQRLTHIRHEVASGTDSVEVDRLPFGSYEHVPDPKPGLWAHRYKLYYGLPDDLTIRLAPARR